MKNTEDYDWELALHVPRCHRWFWGNHPSGERRLAVCDESGEFPDLTDDGVLWLSSKPLRVEMEDSYDEEKKNLFQWCPVHMWAERSDATEPLVSIGGTSGREAFLLQQHNLAKVEFVQVGYTPSH